MTIVCLLFTAVMMLFAYAIGFMKCAMRVHHRVFRPWQDARPVGDPDFWLRARDYAAAWRGFCEATNLFGTSHPDRFSKPVDTFDRAPQGPRRGVRTP